MTKRQNLCLQRRSRPEQSDQREPNQAANISHQPRASPNSTPLASRIEFPTMTTVWPAIVVGVTVFFLVIVASIDLLSVVPANVYGYAALVAYSLHQPSAAPATGPLQNLVSPSFANPLVLLIVSMVIGALFGYASDQLAKVLPTKQPTMAAHV